MDSDVTRNSVSNYLTLSGTGAKNVGYEIKMFEGKKIPGFLEMQVRKMDGNNVYQYRIYNYESLKERYSKSGMQQKDIRRLMGTVIGMNDTVNEFLLDINCVVLKPEYIFVDGDNLCFCYYPEEEQKFTDGLKGLMEYVLEHINHNDRDTVMVAYGLYQRILKNNYTLESLLEVFEEKQEDVPQEITYENTPIQSECVREEQVYQWENQTFPEAEESGFLKKLKNIFRKKRVIFAEPEGGTMLLSEIRFTCLGGGEDIVPTHFPFVIGSKAKVSDFVINSPLISRKHAVVWTDGKSYYLEDAGSTNGTKVNDVRLQVSEKVHLNSGDIIAFANIKFRFE